jgi:two-component system cell cycle sensor histidine kinase/response regulator CckA
MKILIVEDEGIIANNLADSLSRSGYTISGISPSAEDALEKVGTLRPDLVLMDIHLQGEMDGIEGAERLRSEFSIPVIFLTAHANPEFLDRAKRTQPFGYLVKPIRHVELVSAVEVASYKHQMEMKLRQREAWLVTTLRCAGDGVVVTDANGRIEFLNDLSKRILCVQRDRDVIGERFASVVRLKSRHTGLPAGDLVQLAIVQGAAMSIGSDLVLVDPFDQEADIEGEVALSETNGEVVGTVFTFRDVTEHNYREEHKRRDFGNRACARLAGAVSTELRSLQQSLEGNERPLADNIEPGNCHSVAAVTAQYMGSMLRIIGELDTVRRRNISFPRTLNLNALVSNACSELRPDLPFNIQLTSRLQPDLYEIRADAVQIKQAITSLIFHSVDSMPTGGSIRITTRNGTIESYGRAGKEESYVRLTVTNTSPGINTEGARRLFEPFSGIDPSADKLDLRLFLVHGIISGARGLIQAHSKICQGLRFEILLPRSVDSETAISSTAHANSRPEEAVILVLHADHDIRSLVSESLEHEGYDAVGARDLEEVLEWMTTYPAAGSITLLIIDFELYQMNAVALQEKISVRHPDMKILFIANEVVDPAVKKIWAERRARFLDKPFQLKELLGAVNETLTGGTQGEDPQTDDREGVIEAADGALLPTQDRLPSRSS